MGTLIAAWRAAGREIAVVGFGKSGLAAARLLRMHGLAVYASDAGSGARLEFQAETLRGLGAVVQVGGHDLERIARAGAVVVAPGVPPDVPPLVAARAAGVPIVAEVNLGVTELPATAKVIGITGTNGKTTTTSLVAHVLRAGGLHAGVAGNIGTALCDVVADGAAPDWLALELSSFQLHDCPDMAPWIGVLTNLAPNHLDRYRTLQEYYGDKRRLFDRADASSISISHGDLPEVRALLADVPGRHLHFSTERRADGWYDRAARRLMADDVAVCDRDVLPLLGDHNVQNALVAILVAREAGLAPAAIAEGLRSFRAIPHRLEPIREVDGVLWVNDSKSTNVTSTAVAIAALERPFVLLLGGRHKGEPYTRLAPLLPGRCRGVVAYGESASLVEADLGRTVPVVRGGTFEDVLDRAAALAQRGDAVLLSPACSSYDMFDDYEQRGDTFRALVEAR
jgi:UDP-N-acetylmuramoylalanine--D-glutamate ligase